MSRCNKWKHEISKAQRNVSQGINFTILYKTRKLVKPYGRSYRIKYSHKSVSVNTDSIFNFVQSRVH